MGWDRRGGANPTLGDNRNMQGTVQLDAFLADPVGRYLVGHPWVYWCARPDLFGIVMWGRPDADSARALCRALVVEFKAGIPPHRSLVDVSRLESVDGEAFAVLNAYVQTHHAPLQNQVTRLALVRPAGLAGAIAAGFYEVLDSPYPVGVFEEAASALEWLQDAPGTALLEEIAAIHAEQAEVAPVVGQVRALLAEQIGPASARIEVETTARALGLSTRTLQRRLREAGTTFQGEVLSARVRMAQRRMLESDASLTAIALDTGFTSPQHMATVFRRLVGQTPSAWRSERT